jgi:hypothetical protein
VEFFALSDFEPFDYRCLPLRLRSKQSRNCEYNLGFLVGTLVTVNTHHRKDHPVSGDQDAPRSGNHPLECDQLALLKNGIDIVDAGKRGSHTVVV